MSYRAIQLGHRTRGQCRRGCLKIACICAANVAMIAATIEGSAGEDLTILGTPVVTAHRKLSIEERSRAETIIGPEDGRRSRKQVASLPEGARWRAHVDKVPLPYQGSYCAPRFVVRAGNIVMPFERFLLSRSAKDGSYSDESQDVFFGLIDQICAHPNLPVMALTFCAAKYDDPEIPEIGDIAIRSSEDQDWGILRGHTARPWTMLLSPTGDRLATVSTDETIRLWDVPNKIELCRIPAGYHVGSNYLAFSPDGKLLAVNNPNYFVAGGIAIRKTSDGEVVSVLHPEIGSHTCVFASDSESLYVFGISHPRRKNPVRFVQLSVDGSARIERRFRSRHAAHRSAFSVDQKWLATWSEDGDQRVLSVWDTVRGVEVATLPCESGIDDVAFTQDGNLLAVLCRGRVSFFSTRRWRRVPTTLIEHKTDDFCRGRICFVDEDKYLVTAFRHDSFIVWDAPRYSWLMDELPDEWLATSEN